MKDYNTYILIQINNSSLSGVIVITAAVAQSRLLSARSLHRSVRDLFGHKVSQHHLIEHLHAAIDLSSVVVGGGSRGRP